MTLTSIWHQYKGEKTQLHKLHLEIQTNCSSVQGKLSQSTVLILGKQNSDINTPTKITLLTDLWWSVLSQGYKWEPGRSTSTPRVLPLLVILGIHTGCCDGVHWLWWRSLQHESSHYTSVCLTPDEDPAVMNMQPFFYMAVTLAMWKRPWSYFHLAGVKPKEDNKQSATKKALHNYLIPTKSKRRAKYHGPCYSTQSLLYCILKDRDSESRKIFS